jgi:hypothetical protein
MLAIEMEHIMTAEVAIAMGSGVTPERAEAAELIYGALLPAAAKLFEAFPAVSVLDGLMTLYMNAAIACGADAAGIQAALHEAAALFPEAARRHQAMIGHDAGNA